METLFDLTPEEFEKYLERFKQRMIKRGYDAKRLDNVNKRVYEMYKEKQVDKANLQQEITQKNYE